MSEDRHSVEPATPRVLFLTRSLGRGGAERQLIALAAGLHATGWNVAVASFYSGGELEFDLLHAGVPVFDLRKRGRYDLPGFLWRWTRVIRSFKPDIVHGYTPVPNMVALLARVVRRKAPVVWGVRASNMDLAHYDWMARASFKMSCWLARYADLTIANSRAGASHAVVHGCPASRIRVIANGINTDRFRFDPNGRVRLRREWMVGERDVLVGLPGRLDPMKDHPNFLRAAANLKHSGMECRFVCVGSGPEDYAADLRVLGNQLGLDKNMIWVGARDDMASVYSALDVVVSSSCSEGFANIVGEAMACGRRCVVTDVGDSAEIVGSTGIVVPVRDSEALAKGVQALSGQIVPHLGDPDGASRARILEHYSVTRLTSATEAALLGLLEERMTRKGSDAGSAHAKQGRVRQ